MTDAYGNTVEGEKISKQRANKMRRDPTSQTNRSFLWDWSLLVCHDLLIPLEHFPPIQTRYWCDDTHTLVFSTSATPAPTQTFLLLISRSPRETRTRFLNKDNL